MILNANAYKPSLANNINKSSIIANLFITELTARNLKYNIFLIFAITNHL